MKVEAAALLLVAGVCACHKHEDATTPVTTDPAAATTASTQLVASPAPSETAAASASSAGSSDINPQLARREALEQARQSGLIGLLKAGGADPNAPTAAWGRDNSLGNDPLSARSNMWGDAIGAHDDGGAATGWGSGGGGRGEGIGLGNIGTIGHGSGTGQGYGSGSGRGVHGGPTPTVRQGALTVNGRLPPEVIQRIVRQNFGRFRLCYENGLRSDPKLAGTVATKFVIGTDGSVSSAARDASTTMTDSGVVSCVTRAFSGLSFPQPEGGIVVVVYPVIFAPGS